jgi:ADP-ribose pyrophosphatase YjhB (NUDIX family)
MEMVECFNQLNESTGKFIQRSQMKNHPCYFRVVHLWLEYKGSFLVQKRAKKEDEHPFMWAFTTGLVNLKESPIQAMIREANEELSLKMDARELSLVKIIPTHQYPYKTFTYVYYLKVLKTKKFTLNEEVLDVSWWHQKKIKKALELKQFWNYSHLLNDPNYFKELDEMSRD